MFIIIPLFISGFPAKHFIFLTFYQENYFYPLVVIMNIYLSFRNKLEQRKNIYIHKRCKLNKKCKVFSFSFFLERNSMNNKLIFITIILHLSLSVIFYISLLLWFSTFALIILPWVIYFLLYRLRLSCRVSFSHVQDYNKRNNE